MLEYIKDSTFNITAVSTKNKRIAMVVTTIDDDDHHELLSIINNEHFDFLEMDVAPFNKIAKKLNQPKEVLDKHATAVIRTEKSKTYLEFLTQLRDTGYISERVFNNTFCVFDGV